MTGEDELGLLGVDRRVGEHPEEDIEEVRVQARVDLVDDDQPAATQSFQRRHGDSKPRDGSVALVVDGERRAVFHCSTVSEDQVPDNLRKLIIIQFELNPGEDGDGIASC